jgi:cell division protein FtsL
LKPYIGVFVVVIVLLSLFFLNVWQSFRYEYLKREVTALEEQQLEAFEENKRLIAGVAVLETPERIESIATEQLGLNGPFEKPPVIITLGEQND